MTSAARLNSTAPEPTSERTNAVSDWAVCSDLALIGAVVAHNGDAYAELFRRHCASVTATVRMLMGNVTAADDVVADVFVKFWVSPTLFDPERGSLLSFLRLQARTHSIDIVRSEMSRRRRENTTLSAGISLGDDSTVSSVMFADTARSLRNAVELLPPGECEAIMLAFYSGMTYRAVGRRLGVPEGTAKSRIRSGLRRLRQNSDQWGPKDTYQGERAGPLGALAKSCDLGRI